MLPTLEEMMVQPKTSAYGKDQSPIEPGFYTVVDANTGDYYTYRVEEMRGGSLAGKITVSFLRGPDNGADYTMFAFIKQGQLKVWNRFQHGYSSIVEFAAFLIEQKDSHDNARQLYSLKSGRCCRCRRMLTTPESIARGIGPECASKIM